MYEGEKPKRDTATFELAPLSSRVIALILDNIILAFLGGILTNILGGALMGFGVSFLIGVAYQWYFLINNNGQTPGKSLMNIRVVKVDGSPLTPSDAVIRYIGYFINGIVFGVGWLWALFDSNFQGWHDKLANTYVIRA